MPELIKRTVPLLFGLVLFSGCSRSDQAEIAKAEAEKARAEAELAKAELEKLKAEQAKPQPMSVATSPTLTPPARPSKPDKNGPDAWYFAWKVIANDAGNKAPKPGEYSHGWHSGDLDTTYGIRPPFEGAGKHSGIMILHPVSGNEPAKISYTAAIPADRTTLVVDAAGSNAGDCLLRCVVNGNDVGEYVLDGKKWTKCEFDLSAYAGKSANVELWNVPGGANDWYFETCFIDRIEFAKAASPSASAHKSTTPPPGPVVFEHTLSKPGVRNVMTVVHGQYYAAPKLEPGVGFKLTGGHTAPAIWTKQYLGQKYRAAFDMKLDTEHAWAVVMLNGPGYGNSHDVGYGCRVDIRNVALLRDGKTEETIEKSTPHGEWVHVEANIDGGSIEVLLDGVPLAAMEDPTPLSGSANGWFGVVGREVVLRNLKVWSPESDTKRERHLTSPETEKPAANGKLLFELALSGDELGAEWHKTQPTAVNIKDGGIVLQEGNGTPDIVLGQALAGDLACEVEFEYHDEEAVNFSLALLFAQKAPTTIEEINQCDGWRVALPNGNGNSAILWQRKSDGGEGVWRHTQPLVTTGYYAPIPRRKYLARFETRGNEVRVFLDGGLLLKTAPPEDVPSPTTPAFFDIRQIYGGSKVYAVRIYEIVAP